MLSPIQKSILEILARRSGLRFPSILKKQERAPAGGVFLVNMKGESKFFPGGQWIPAQEIANLPPAEKAKLEAAKQQAKMGRIQRGDVNPAELQQQLRPHARKLNAEENKRAVGELRALHNYHGALTLHRIEQLAQQQQGFLKRKNLTAQQKEKIEGNLARLHAMAVTSHRLGVTGQVPKEMQQESLAKTAKEPPQHLEKPEEKAQKPPEQMIPSTSENHPANPDASGFLNTHAFLQQPQFGDDALKASEALGEIVRRHQEGGGKVQVEGEGLRFLPAEKKEEPAKTDPDTQRNIRQVEEAIQRRRDAEKPAARTEAPMSPEDAAKALAKQAGHEAQPKEGSDAASEMNRQLIEEGKKPDSEAAERLRRNKERLAQAAKEVPQKKPETEEERNLRRNKELAARAEIEHESPDAPDEEKEQRLREHYALNYGPGREQSKEREEAHEKEVWSGKARKEGIEPKDLHAAAKQVMKEDAEHVARRRNLLARARELFTHYGYDARALTTNLRSGRVEDDVPAWDVVTRALSREFPEEFGGILWERGADEYNDKDNALLGYFEEGVPKPITLDRAYEQAFDFLKEQKEQAQEREPGADEEEENNTEPWLEEEEEYDPFASQWKRLRVWIQKSRRSKPSGPLLPGMSNFDESLHPRETAGSGHDGQFAPKHVQDAISRYANRDKVALGGGLFGGEDLQARHGFAKLPHGTPIVFTSGEFEGRTGKIVRDVDDPTGAPRIVAEVDGRPGLVPISPDSIEPVDVRHSWRTEGGGSGREEKQGALYTAEHYLPRREADPVKDAFDRYEAIKADLPKLSVEEMRSRFAELATLPKAVLAGVLAKLGYPAESSKKDIETALLDNLTSLKISLDQTARIKE